jgi:hypothetical protein
MVCLLGKHAQYFLNVLVSELRLISGKLFWFTGGILHRTNDLSSVRFNIKLRFSWFNVSHIKIVNKIILKLLNLEPKL